MPKALFVFLLLCNCILGKDLLVYFENLEVGCFPPSLEDKKKHFLMLANPRLQWKPNANVADGTFTFRFNPNNGELTESTEIEYKIAVEKLKKALPNLRIINFQGVLIQGGMGADDFVKWSHRTYHQVFNHAQNLVPLCQTRGYTVPRFFFTVIIPRQMCEAHSTPSTDGCQWLYQRLLPEFHDERRYVIPEEETLFTISQHLNGSNIQFMIAF
ncbi:unnamed protein product [Bursaphelenchus xylophilus]|uniref:(pine wood nematode) hypothetical protein n=1 Tax=Bursaphelenchus xylophilus TaxID=6326 RepID=A0A1I7RN29_BURXY|nr:unnamed protein product [Bursaphelenchus xylophilus]CAG9087626.1 unnamed protein product [Bursaphelenchus xylophilus]